MRTPTQIAKELKDLKKEIISTGEVKATTILKIGILKRELKEIQFTRYQTILEKSK